MMVMCNDIIIIDYDERRRGLPYTPLHIQHDNNRITEIGIYSHSSKHTTYNIQHTTYNNPYIFINVPIHGTPPS